MLPSFCALCVPFVDFVLKTAIKGEGSHYA